MDATVYDDLVGQIVLHYQVTERLGSGGMGVVYRAVDLKLKRTVALKFLPASQVVSAEAKERFMREAMASSALDDTNIGTVHAIEETGDGKLFLVMACYDGPTLAQKVARGPIPSDQAVAIALQLLRGLDAAHRHGIVHRDIKPGNLIFNSQGVLKILDFGLAKLQGSSDLTLPGSTLGTAAYMAPEQATGSAADHRADLWSAGVVLYEMLSGRRPFHGTDMRSLMYAVISRQPEVLPAALPPPLQRVLKRALQKDPALRYQSAEEMVCDLEPARSLHYSLGSEETTVTHIASPPVPSRQTPTARWRRWLVSIIVVAVLAAAIFGFWMLRRPGPVVPGLRTAVLPFTTQAESPQDLASSEALAGGLRSQLIRSLGGLEDLNRGLLVVPSNELAAQHVTDPAGARRSLGLGIVLSGSLTRSGDRLRVVLNSIDTASLKVQKLEVVNGTISDLPGLEREMVDRSAKILGIKTAKASAQLDAQANLPASESQAYLESLGNLERADKPGNLDAAIEELVRITNSAPKFVPGYAALAEACLLMYKTTKNPQALDQADQYAGRAAQAGPQLPQVALVLGRVRSAQGKYPEAVSQFQRVISIDARNGAALEGLAQAYAAMGLPDKAVEAWQNAITANPTSTNPYNQLAAFELNRGDYAKSAFYFQKALELAPDNATIMSNFGAALLYAGSLEKSRQVLQNSIRLAPSYAAWTNLGNLDLKQGRFADAAADYERALEFNKSDYRVWSNMAVAYSRTPGQKDKAKDAFLHAAQMCRDALKINPNDPLVLSDLAMFVASEGDERQEPLTLIEKALVLAPEDTYVQFNAAETYEALGYRKEALDWVGKLVAAGYPLDDIKDSPVLADLVKDLRFQAMAKTRNATASTSNR